MTKEMFEELAKMMPKDKAHSIDVSDLGIEGWTELTFKMPSSTDIGVLWSHPFVKGAHEKEDRDARYQMVLIHLVIHKANPDVTLEHIKNLPLQAYMAISQRIVAVIGMGTPELKN